MYNMIYNDNIQQNILKIQNGRRSMLKKLKLFSRALVIALLIQNLIFPTNLLSSTEGVYAEEVTQGEEAIAPENTPKEVEGTPEENDGPIEENKPTSPEDTAPKDVNKDNPEETNTDNEVKETTKPTSEEEVKTEDKQPISEEDEIPKDKETEESDINEEANENIAPKINEEIEIAEKKLVSLQLDSKEYSMEKGETSNIMVTAIYSDDSIEDVTTDAEYSTSDTTVAQIDAKGKITALSMGEAFITAEYQGISSQAVISIEKPVEKVLLEAPKSILTFSTEEKIYLKWDAVEGSTSYDIEIDGNMDTNVSATEYIHARLQPNTEHIFRIRSKNQETEGMWSGEVVVKTLASKPISFIEYSINLKKDELVDIIFTASGINNLKSRTFTLSYNPQNLEVVDLCTLTGENDTSTGAISGTDITILEYSPGTIKMMINKGINENEIWSGVVNTIKFRAKIGGKSGIKYVVE